MTDESTIEERVPTRVSQFVLERLAEDVLLYHPGLTKMIRLNGTAAVVWDLCDGQSTVGEIVQMLTDAYPEDEPQIRDDVETVLRRFVAEGAVALG